MNLKRLKLTNGTWLNFVHICWQRLKILLKMNRSFVVWKREFFSYWAVKHESRKTSLLLSVPPCSEIRNTFLELAIQLLSLFSDSSSSSLYYMLRIDISSNFYSWVGAADLRTPAFKKRFLSKVHGQNTIFFFCQSGTISRRTQTATRLQKLKSPGPYDNVDCEILVWHCGVDEGLENVCGLTPCQFVSIDVSEETSFLLDSYEDREQASPKHRHL